MNLHPPHPEVLAAGERADVTRFCRECGLPARLADLGLPSPGDEDYALIARPTLAASHMKHLAKPASEDSLVAATKRVERHAARD